MSEELDTRRGCTGFPGELGHAKEQVLWNPPFSTHFRVIPPSPRSVGGRRRAPQSKGWTMSSQGQAGLPGAPGFPGLRGDRGPQVGVGSSSSPVPCAHEKQVLLGSESTGEGVAVWAGIRGSPGVFGKGRDQAALLPEPGLKHGAERALWRGSVFRRSPWEQGEGTSPGRCRLGSEVLPTHSRDAPGWLHLWLPERTGQWERRKRSFEVLWSYLEQAGEF